MKNSKKKWMLILTSVLVACSISVGAMAVSLPSGTACSGSNTLNCLLSKTQATNCSNQTLSSLLNQLTAAKAATCNTTNAGKNAASCTQPTAASKATSCTGNVISLNGKSISLNSDTLNRILSKFGFGNCNLTVCQQGTVTQPSGSAGSSDETATPVDDGADDVTVPADNGSGDTTQPADNNGSSGGATIGNLSFEEQVAVLVNEQRAAYGLAPLVLSEELSNVARAKSQDMHDNHYFSHTSPTYGSPFQMMTSFGISYRSAGENIAMGYSTPEAVMNAWMNSQGHRANILSASYTQIGVGYVADGNYWTQEFIG